MKYITKLKNRLDACIDEYTELFCLKQECSAEGWIGNIKGGLNCFSDAFLSLEDIRLDLEMDAPKGAIWDWYWDNRENEDKAINYYSYLLGLRIKNIKPIKWCDNPHCVDGKIPMPYNEFINCSICESND